MKLFVLLGLLLGTLVGIARVEGRHGDVLKTTRWEPIDVVFAGPEEVEGPFEVEFSARLECEGKESLTVPGFFDGGNRFVIRVALPEVGTWEYETSSSVGPLDGLSGKIEVGEAGEGKHGPVSTDGGQGFRYADGTSYYPIAFECDWLFAIDAENSEGIPKTAILTEQIAANGFNQVVMNVFAYDVNWARDPKLGEEFDYARPEVFPFGGDNEEPDHSRLEVGFFQHFDRVMDRLEEKGLVGHVMIYVWNKQVNWPESRSVEDNRYFDYVVKRYQAYPNLIWDISKEATGYGHNDVHYITDRIERLRKLDGHRRLVTVHDVGYCMRFPEQVDFISVQSWKTELYGAMSQLRAKFPKKPVFNIEHGGYEEGPYLVFKGNFLSAEACLERAYECVFAGVYPTHYWQDTSWSVVIHDPLGLPEAERPKFEYYKHLATLVEELDLAGAEPTPASKYSNGGFCLKLSKGGFAVYVPRENSALKMKLRGHVEGPVTTRWFNPMTGEFTEPVPMKVEQWSDVAIHGWDHFGVLIAEPGE